MTNYPAILPCFCDDCFTHMWVGPNFKRRLVSRVSQARKFNMFSDVSPHGIPLRTAEFVPEPRPGACTGGASVSMEAAGAWRMSAPPRMCVVWPGMS